MYGPWLIMRVLTLRGLSELLSAGRTDLIVVGSSGPISDLRLRFDDCDKCFENFANDNNQSMTQS